MNYHVTPSLTIVYKNTRATLASWHLSGTIRAHKLPYQFVFKGFGMTSIEIVEVGARDGLQNEKVLFSTEQKLKLIRDAMAAGVKRLEVASFVHPKLVPQMADAEAVIAGLPQDSDATYIGLVLNKRGLFRALETRAGGARGVDEVGAVAIASDTFATKNQGNFYGVVIG